MGITGLLPFLKSIHQEVSISKFKGCTVAIDAYCWLHKGAFACADKLAVGEATNVFVNYCMKFVIMLLSWDIKPILVFDGCHLPSKKGTEKKRREARESNRRKAAELLRAGKRSEAREALQRCVDITPQMALQLMQAARAKGVDCIVAPYEADAQLAYLCKAGIAQVIITEDSDLLVFGCDRVMFKMDANGRGILIEKSQLNNAVGTSVQNMTFARFRHMCILSGCDYLPSLTGIGLVTAAKIMRLARNPDITMVLKRLSSYTKKPVNVPKEYIAGFVQADNTFLYQLVFDPLKRKLVPLTHYSPEVDPKELDYAGPSMPHDRGLQVALGNIDIYTGESIAKFNPDQPFSNKIAGSIANHRRSIWDPRYRPHNPLTDKPKGTTPRESSQGKEQVLQVKVNNLRHSSTPSPARATDNSETTSELLTMYIDDKLIAETTATSPLNVAPDTDRSNPDKENSPLKENPTTSLAKKKPRNIFSSSFHGKTRPQFSLGAGEVKSRFFASSTVESPPKEAESCNNTFLDDIENSHGHSSATKSSEGSSREVVIRLGLNSLSDSKLRVLSGKPVARGGSAVDEICGGDGSLPRKRVSDSFLQRKTASPFASPSPLSDRLSKFRSGRDAGGRASVLQSSPASRAPFKSVIKRSSSTPTARKDPLSDLLSGLSSGGDGRQFGRSSQESVSSVTFRGSLESLVSLESGTEGGDDDAESLDSLDSSCRLDGSGLDSEDCLKKPGTTSPDASAKSKDPVKEEKKSPVIKRQTSIKDMLSTFRLDKKRSRQQMAS